MGFFVGPLSTVVARYCAIVIEAYPLGLLVQPVAHRDVEVADLPIVGGIPCWGFIECVFVVEYLLLEVIDAILVVLGHDTSGGFSVSDGLEKPIGNPAKQCCIEVWLCLERGVNSVG